MVDNLQEMLGLAIDCQTSGSSVENSHLLEIGWLPIRAAEAENTDGHLPTVHLIRPPDDWQLPARIERLTGIDDGQLKNGLTPVHAWQELLEIAHRLAARNKSTRCPAVIHFARFEMGFIQKLAAQYGAGCQIPIEAICTHQIATRLLPTLPRKGLRAVAGYFGHSVGKQKRCLDHLFATRSVWRHLVKRLADELDISTLDQLRRWLKASQTAASTKRVYPMPRQARLHVPKTSGIYHMKRSNGDLLYIGKAANLKQRINSYFHSSVRHSENILEMLSQAVCLDITVTPSALEAALLESDKIKQHKPLYNLALTGDHRQLYFLSRDFNRHAKQPDDLCTIGPVMPISVFTAAAAIGGYLTTDQSTIDAPDIPRILAMPQRRCPDLACLRLGMDLFRKKHHPLFGNALAVNDLIRIGRLSWIEKMNRRQTLEQTEIESEDEMVQEQFVWTPETVVNAFESIVRHCGFLLRRARWLAMLSEATISWQVRDPASDRYNRIILCKGGIAKRYCSKANNSLPVPPGAGLKFKDRQANLSLQTYDRLRVLTTEIRRLIAEQRPLCIRLNRKVYLHENQLQRLLKWI